MQSEQKLLAGSFVDRIAIGSRSQLGPECQQRPRPSIRRSTSKSRGSGGGARRRSGRASAPQAQGRGRVAHDRGEEVPFALETGLEDTWRCRRLPHVPRRAGRRRREPGKRLAGEVEPIGEEPQRLLALRRVLDAGRGPRVRGRTPPVDPRRARARSGRGTRRSSPRSRVVPRTCRARRQYLTLRQADDPDVEPLLHGELHAAKGCLLPRCVGVEERKRRLVRRPRSPAGLRSTQCPSTRRPTRSLPVAARSRRYCPRPRSRDPALRSQGVRGAGRTGRCPS